MSKNERSESGDVALEERDSDVRPAIANLPDSIDQYDRVLIGYPIWWHTAPMIIGTFLESYDLTDKEVYPFTQSASMDTEQFDNSIRFVRDNAAGATSMTVCSRNIPTRGPSTIIFRRTACCSRDHEGNHHEENRGFDKSDDGAHFRGVAGWVQPDGKRGFRKVRRLGREEGGFPGDLQI